MIFLHRVTLAGLMVVVAAYLWLASELKLDVWAAADPITPRTLPLVYGALALILLVVLAVQSASQAAEPTSRGSLVGWRRAIASLLMLVAFAFLLPWSGLWLGAGALLAGLLTVMGERHAGVLIGAPVLFGAMGWLIVEVGLGVFLPAGLWFDV